MTRRHYVMLAEALRTAMPSPTDTGAGYHYQQYCRDCAAIAAALARDNPHGFDRALFLRNCGINQQE